MKRSVSHSSKTIMNDKKYNKQSLFTKLIESYHEQTILYIENKRLSRSEKHWNILSKTQPLNHM